MSWRRFLRRKRWDEERARELEAYLQAETEENMARGMSADEARRAAHLKLGNATRIREEIYEMNSLGWLETLWQDVHYGLRMLRKNRGFTVVAVLTLALGIGANTAIFSVIDSVLLRPLPYKDPGNLVMVWERRVNPHNTVAPPDFLDWQSQNTVFADMAAIVDERDNLTGTGQPEQVVVQLVSPNFFAVLGVNPILGRGFTAENGQASRDNVLILSYGFWKERFGGDPEIVGKTILLNGHSQIVVGVAPRDFNWFIKDGSLTGAKPQMWAPWVLPQRFRDRKQIGRFMTVVARLKPGVTLPQAQTQMNTIATRLAREFPDFNKDWGINVVSLREQLSGDLRPALLILFGAVAFVLLIACANVSSLLLARAAARGREMAIRTAIGASRRRIARQLLTESLLLAIAGGGLGVLLAFWGTNALLAASPHNLLGLDSVPIDFRILIFAFATTLLAGLLFGFLPSYISAHSKISETLKEGGRGTSGGKQRRVARSAFVVAQVGLSLVLLAGSGLLIRSFMRLLGVDPGFNASHLLTFKVVLPLSKYGTDQTQMVFFEQLLTRIQRLPSVSSVS
ncbi:MAG: ABC transporter permease, partial [Candidatus Acidiferrales bacterium]